MPPVCYSCRSCLSPHNLKTTQALLQANDFIGLSAYGSGYPTDAAQLTYRSAEIPLYTLAYELSFFGIDLKQYMDKPVLYVEQVRLDWAASTATCVVMLCRLGGRMDGGGLRWWGVKRAYQPA